MNIQLLFRSFTRFASGNAIQKFRNLILRFLYVNVFINMFVYIKNVKLVITFFPYLTGIDKIHFRFPEKILYKKHFFSALSKRFPQKFGFYWTIIIVFFFFAVKNVSGMLEFEMYVIFYYDA